jgi:hypothetical protein
MRSEDIHKLEMFLCKVNKVTAPFRHNASISNDALVVLSNDQIEMEQWVKDRRAELVVSSENNRSDEIAFLESCFSVTHCHSEIDRVIHARIAHLRDRQIL